MEDVAPRRMESGLILNASNLNINDLCKTGAIFVNKYILVKYSWALIKKRFSRNGIDRGRAGGLVNFTTRVRLFKRAEVELYEWPGLRFHPATKSMTFPGGIITRTTV